jgi:hypothetical protein
MQQFFFSSSDVNATTCFDHSIIISKPLATVLHCLPPDDDRIIETCCGINTRRGEEELLR